MADISIRIEGQEHVISHMLVHDKQFKDGLTKIVKKAANDVKATGKEIAPDGRPWKSNWKYANIHKKINQSISARFTGNGNDDLRGIRATVAPGKQAYQRAFFVNGTKQRYTKSGKYVGQMKPVHYMEEAESRHESEYKGAIKSLVELHVEL